MDQFNETLQNFGEIFSKSCTSSLEKSQVFSFPQDSFQKEFDLEERFKIIEIPIPKVHQSEKLAIKKWLGEICKVVFSRGFKLFEEKRMDKEQKRAFCCENMIHNIMNLMRENNFGKSEIKLINKILQKEIIPNLLSCYPKSKNSEVNRKLSNLIRKVDNNESNENDLVAKSKVKFEYKESGEYYS